MCAVPSIFGINGGSEEPENLSSKKIAAGTEGVNKKVGGALSEGSLVRTAQRFLAVVPARGGSQGLPGKNLKVVQGISLVARAVWIARQIDAIEWVFVSTDDEGIASEGRRAGASVPFLRPPELAQSDTPMLTVLEHTCEWFCTTHANSHTRLDGIVLLAPTCPMRKVEHVRAAIATYQAARNTSRGVAAVHTVSPVPAAFHPLRHWRKVADVDPVPNVSCGRFRRHSESSPSTLFYRNGAAIVLDHLRLDALNLKQGPVLPYVIEEPLVSIDSIVDLHHVEHCGRTLEPEASSIDWKIASELTDGMAGGSRH
ncbi:MAG: acylneuraminate cytidylyltransferase family protein [Gammaproteobacteria bacterium]|nr:acylneuraminate cytidylyltransferase family protein [Gammaproteobacteria bacterium]